MHLSIDSLKEAGAFTGAPIEKEITWKQGDKELTATVYVRPLSYSTAVSDLPCDEWQGRWRSRTYRCVNCGRRG